MVGKLYRFWRLAACGVFLLLAILLQEYLIDSYGAEFSTPILICLRTISPVFLACIILGFFCYKSGKVSKYLDEKIRERDRLAQALVSSEERFRTLFEHSPEAVALFDPIQEKFFDFNEEAHKSLGYQQGELQSLSIEQMEKHSRSDGIRHHIAQTMRQGMDSFDAKVCIKTGEIREFSFQTRKINVHHKEFILTIWIDHTEQNLIKRQAIEQFQFQKTLLETIPCPIFYKNIEGKYTGCNRAFEEFIGKKREEIIGKTVYEIARKDIAERYFRKDLELFRKPGVQSYKWKVETPRGLRRVIFHKASFCDAEGRLEGLIGVILDINDLHEAEKEIEQNRQMLLLRNRLLTELTSRELFAIEELNEALRKVCRAAVAGLGVDRAGIWQFSQEREKIECILEYSQKKDEFSCGGSISRENCPGYFDAISNEQIVAADNAHKDPLTRELVDDYLVPMDVHSLLDVPIHINGELYGIFCNEQQGSPRRWSPAEHNFAISIGNLTSLLLEIHDRRQFEKKLG